MWSNGYGGDSMLVVCVSVVASPRGRDSVLGNAAGVNSTAVWAVLRRWRAVIVGVAVLDARAWCCSRLTLSVVCEGEE